MTTNTVNNNVAQKVVAPNLPTAAGGENKPYLDQLTNVLRLYFASLNSSVNNVIDVVSARTGGLLSTTATNGFTYVSTCAGVPTGVPVKTPTGTVPLVYDTVHNNLYIYNGGWKKTTTFT